MVSADNRATFFAHTVRLSKNLNQKKSYDINKIREVTNNKRF